MWYMWRTELTNKLASVHCGYDQNSRNRKECVFDDMKYMHCSGPAGQGSLLGKLEPLLGLSQIIGYSSGKRMITIVLRTSWSSGSLLYFMGELSMCWEGQDFRGALLVWEELSSRGTCHVFSCVTDVLKVHFVFREIHIRWFWQPFLQRRSFLRKQTAA